MSSNSQFSNSRNEYPELSPSLEVHRFIIFMNSGAIALLQVAEQSTDAADNKQITIFFFCLFFLIYAVLGVIEVKLTANQPGQTIRHFVGYVSHLFGALAPLHCLSRLHAPLWLVWFVFIMYVFITKLMCVDTNDSEDANQSEPVSQAL